MKIFSLQRLKQFGLHCLFWSLVYAFFVYFFGFNAKNQAYVFWFSSLMLPITITNTYFSTYFLIPKYLLTKKYGRFFLYSLYTLIVTALIASFAVIFSFAYLSELNFHNFEKLPPFSRSMPFILISVYLVVAIVSSFKLLLHNNQSLEKNKSLENDFLQAELQLKEEELKFLKSQIHPHFLFNTLNTIYGFALKKADETPEMILKLSGLLDYILYQLNKPAVLLTDELKHIENYISLEKMRFGDALDINLTSTQAITTYELAPMLLIPFVENAFKHGAVIDDVLTINMEVKTTGNKLEFELRNSINDKQIQSNGIGLKNIKKRLEILYPSKHHLEITQTKNEFQVLLILE
jgi:sensor histidine kinase YesM